MNLETLNELNREWSPTFGTEATCHKCDGHGTIIDFYPNGWGFMYDCPNCKSTGKEPRK